MFAGNQGQEVNMGGSKDCMQSLMGIVTSKSQKELFRNTYKRYLGDLK